MLPLISFEVSLCIFLMLGTLQGDIPFNVRHYTEWHSIYLVSASDPSCVPPRVASARPAGCRRGWCRGNHAMTTPSCHVAAIPSPAPIAVPPASLRLLFRALWETQGTHRSDVSILAISAGRVLLQDLLRHLQHLWVEHKEFRYATGCGVTLGGI
jgi:hypothetical protein